MTLSSKKIRKSGFYMLISLYILLVIFIIYASVFLVLSSFRFSKKIEATTFENGNLVANLSTDLMPLFAEHNFLNARMMLVNEDSVSMTIDLRDSLVTLEIKGVILHMAKINTIHTSRILHDIDPAMMSSYLSSPLQVKNCTSTIPKFKYFIKVAPNDTIAPIEPPAIDTTSGNFICFRYILDAGLQIDIRQSNQKDIKGARNFNRTLRINESKRIIKQLASLNVPDFYPVIYIELSSQDAKSIYKALPMHPKMVIRV